MSCTFIKSNPPFLRLKMNQSDRVHRIKDILVHNIDDQTGLFAVTGHLIGEIRKCAGEGGDIDHHNHDKHILKDCLGHIDDVDFIFSTQSADFGEDADCIFTDDRNNSTQKLPPDSR